MDENFATEMMLSDLFGENSGLIAEFVPDEEEVENVPDMEEAEVVEVPTMLIGIVTSCTKLNIRNSPDKTAEVVGQVFVNSELVIDVEKSNDDWYCVCTSAGVEGFCMRDFVTVKQ